MKTIGIIGLGFVGNAVFQTFKHHYNICAYDLKKGLICKLDKMSGWVSINDSQNSIEDYYRYVSDTTNGPIFICLPTPMYEDGKANLTIIDESLDLLHTVTSKIPRTIVIKSTVPPCTTDIWQDTYHNFKMVFNPEFLTEANAVKDYQNQKFIIHGSRDSDTKYVMDTMFKKVFPTIPQFAVDLKTAEMVKYFINTFLAIKVSFANEMKILCDGIGVPYDQLIKLAQLDTRIGQSHLQVPGPDGKLGFGGSCFPKDINALMHLFQEIGIDPLVLDAAWKRNIDVRPEQDWKDLIGRAVLDEGDVHPDRVKQMHIEAWKDRNNEN